jgi:hypothetical protein
MTSETGDSYDYLLEMPVTELDLSDASVSAIVLSFIAEVQTQPYLLMRYSWLR